MASLLLLRLFLTLWVSCFGLLIRADTTAEVEVDATGQQQHITDTQKRSSSAPQPVKATFVNQLPNDKVNLYWAGNAGTESSSSSPNHALGGLQLFYGPLDPSGGTEIVDGYENSIFVLTEAGTYNRLGEYVLSGEEGGKQTFVLTEDAATRARGRFPPQSLASERKEELSQSCRKLDDDVSSGKSFLDRCKACAEAEGCGYALIRSGSSSACFASHTLATINDARECQELNDVEEAQSKSVDAWLNAATDLILGEGMQDDKNSAGAFRLAYTFLDRAVERAEQQLTEKPDDKAALLTVKKAAAARSELSAKLDAVFDDADAQRLLETSRHPKLAEVHPNMFMVDRRTADEAVQYIARGEPVVITDLFDHVENGMNPVSHKWTMEYLSRNVFGESAAAAKDGGDKAPPKFNVAADIATRCCRYFEPQGYAKEAGYPYPFAPTTHLYRDSFDGFVRTVRKASRNSYVAETNAGATTIAKKVSSPKRVLHYLHEIVMNAAGEAMVAGGAAPQRLAEDLAAATARLRPLASYQPFFGGFANAKVWIGQRGIVMPMHYDATDNLYVMAWGKKKAIVGEPGQLDVLYRYPNGHPLAGSSQVNLTEADLQRYPNFSEAKLREVIVGPGDVLYLPAWWWHQFEQPFEGTAALNLWSKDRDRAPETSMRDMRIREHLLADRLEESVVELFGNEAGIVLDALAGGGSSERFDESKLKQAQAAQQSAAEAWHLGTRDLPGDHSKLLQAPSSLVSEHLERTYSKIMSDEDRTSWKPGVEWDLSQIAKLPRELRDRCKAAGESSPFMSLCSE